MYSKSPVYKRERGFIFHFCILYIMFGYFFAPTPLKQGV